LHCCACDCAPSCAAGLVDCILESLNDHPDPSLKRSILESVLVCGGGACIPGLGDRILQVRGVRPLVC
jgi:actin-related protein